MTDTKHLDLRVGHIPANHTVVGYITSIKVLDENGEPYYAIRTDGLSDMEKLGMAVSMGDDFRHQMVRISSPIEDGD